MAIGAALYSYLIGVSGVTDLVSMRIYPNVAPQDADLPNVAYMKVDDPRLLAHDGPTGLAFPRLQLTVTAANYADAQAVCDALRTALDGYRGTWSSTAIYHCSIENETDGYNLEAGYHTMRQDYAIQHEES